jgi:hypothetical protein
VLWIRVNNSRISCILNCVSSCTNDTHSFEEDPPTDNINIEVKVVAIDSDFQALNTTFHRGVKIVDNTSTKRSVGPNTVAIGDCEISGKFELGGNTNVRVKGTLR